MTASSQPLSAGRLAWLAGYAGVTFLSFPHPIGGRVVDLGVPLAWAGPALLLLGLEGLSARRAAALALGASLVAHAAILHWIWVVTVVYGHAHPAVGVLGSLGLGAYIAVFTAAFAGVYTRLARAGWGSPSSPFVAAALWTALDQLRSFALSGFPWATLGYAQHGNPLLLALAPFTGVYGLSFVTVLGGAALARLARARRSPRSSNLAAGVALATVLAAHAAGLLLRAAEPPDPTETVRVAVLQGNIPQGVKWSREWYERTLGVYEGLSRRALAQGAELIVWPETAVPGVIDTDARHTERLAAFVRETGAVFVLGAVGLERRGGGEPLRVYDSAFLVNAQGAFTDRYDKSHLVPFGEYIPFQDLLGRFIKAIARGVAETRVTAGAGPRPVELDAPRSGRLTAGVAICYELIFPDVVRRFVRDGAEILLAITNDAWYGRTGAPYQFLAITAMRSAETRVWTARAANTGVSAIIDARGRVREQTRIFERDLLVADVPRRPAPVGGSFYARHGDVFAAACWLVVAGIWLAARRAEAKAGGGGV
jgi:apolipoprotein N-acyltransferase